MSQKIKLPSISLYKRIAVSFLVLTIILIMVISYFSWGKAVIKVEPMQQKRQVEFFIDVGQRSPTTESLANLIPAKILETTIEDTKSFPTTGKKKAESKGNSVGKITVINDSNQSYNFVAKTRFLSADGILFRMLNPAKIPAKGTVEVDVYPDDKKFTGVLNPTTFTIPGLREATQKLVYGSTSKALATGGEDVYYVTDDDVNKAVEILSNQLKMQALSVLRDQLKFRERLFADGTQVEILSQTVKPAINDVAENFDLSLKVKVVGVSLNESELQDEMKIKIREQLPAGTEIMNFDPANVKYTMEKYDVKGQIITFKVFYAGETIITKDNKIFDKENLTGLDEQGVKNYFANFNDIQSVEVDFSPFWVTRVPNLIDRVDIILVK
jgi:hypothetical protein